MRKSSMLILALAAVFGSSLAVSLGANVKALYSTGAKGGGTENLARAKYYRAEAELWLVEAGGNVPKERLD